MTCGDTQINDSDIRQRIRQMSSHNRSIGMTEFQKQFEVNMQYMLFKTAQWYTGGRYTCTCRYCGNTNNIFCFNIKDTLVIYWYTNA